MSLGGFNTFSGTIQLEQNVGIGVENPDPAVPQSELTTTGPISDLVSYTDLLRMQVSSGTALEDPNLLPTFFPTGKVVISYNLGARRPLLRSRAICAFTTRSGRPSVRRSSTRPSPAGLPRSRCPTRVPARERPTCSKS